MSESSWLWTTGGSTGDGSNTYTRTDWSNIAKVFAACHDDEGIAPSWLNSCSPTVPAANTIRIDTGGALVDGKPYYSSATSDLNIPNAVGGGNTRIDRIVLRANWTAQTVRLTRIAGTDAASPAAPAITQTPGTTYDIQVCQALVDTAGAVTATDERTLAKVQTAGIADSAVTTAKINALGVTTALLANDSVDDTKAGNRVPQFYRRQGGDASNWASAGTTNYTPGTVRMQGGVRAVTIANGQAQGAAGITFPQTFSNTPIVLVSAQHDISATDLPEVYAGAGTDLDYASVNVYARRAGTSGALTINVHWLAIGPE
jgi:hypothetical protein